MKYALWSESTDRHGHDGQSILRRLVPLLRSDPGVRLGLVLSRSDPEKWRMMTASTIIVLVWSPALDTYWTFSAFAIGCS